MTEQELAAIAAHYDAGDRVDHIGDDGCPDCHFYGPILVDEVQRLRDLLANQHETAPQSEPGGG